VVAHTPTGLVASGKHVRISHRVLLYCCAVAALGCGEVGSLAISAGAPVSAAVAGRITECGRAVSGAEVVLRVQQDEPHQARPVDVQLGPITTGRDGWYVAEVGPSFAVPGAARLDLDTVNGISMELAGPDLSFTLGAPPRDTVRFDADIGLHRRTCAS
jgi:hypothetical protein